MNSVVNSGQNSAGTSVATSVVTSVEVIITTALKSIATRPEYLKLLDEIKTELAKLALNAAASLNSIGSHYQISLRNNSGMASDILLKTLAKETWLVDLLKSGDCLLNVNGNNGSYLVISFRTEYIDGLIGKVMGEESD